MSFAVFGVTMNHCLKVARKRVKAVTGVGDKMKRLTPEEYEQAVQDYAHKLFKDIAEGKKVAPKISADMSQPSAAKEFIELANRTTQCAKLQIYQRAPVKGKVNPRTKLPVMKFQPWPLREDAA